MPAVFSTGALGKCRDGSLPALRVNNVAAQDARSPCAWLQRRPLERATSEIACPPFIACSAAIFFWTTKARSARATQSRRQLDRSRSVRNVSSHRISISQQISIKVRGAGAFCAMISMRSCRRSPRLPLWCRHRLESHDVARGPGSILCDAFEIGTNFFSHVGGHPVRVPVVKRTGLWKIHTNQRFNTALAICVVTPLPGGYYPNDQLRCFGGADDA